MLINITCPRCKFRICLRCAEQRIPKHGWYSGSDVFACEYSGTLLIIKVGNHYHPVMKPPGDADKTEISA